MQQQLLLTNSYIPKKTEKKRYEWYKHDLMTYIDNLKYKQFVEDMDSNFSRAEIPNFDLIHHQCRGDKLQNSRRHYETIFDSDFKNYEDCTHNQTMQSAIKAERDDIHFELDLLKSHIKSNIEKDLISNDNFIKKSKIKCTTDDCKSLKLQKMASVAESDFCMAVSNSLHEKYKGQIETKFLASFENCNFEEKTVQDGGYRKYY